MFQPDNSYPPLSFVNLKGFGSTPIPVQVSIDQRFLIISTYYTLSPVIATPENITNYIGQLAELIAQDKNIFQALLSLIEIESSEIDTRIKLDDPLLLVRSFLYLKNKKAEQPLEFTLDKETLAFALNVAIEQDDLVKSLHFNVVNALKKLKE